MPNIDLSHHLPAGRRAEGYSLNAVGGNKAANTSDASRRYLRVELRHNGNHIGSVSDWVGKDGPTVAQSTEDLPDRKAHPKANELRDAMHAAFAAHSATLHKSESVTKRDPAAPAPTPKPPKVGALPKPPKPPKLAAPKATQAGSVSVTTIKSEPTAILDAARVDAEVERRLAEIEGAREGLSKSAPRFGSSSPPVQSNYFKESPRGGTYSQHFNSHTATTHRVDHDPRQKVYSVSQMTHAGEPGSTTMHTERYKDEGDRLAARDKADRYAKVMAMTQKSEPVAKSESDHVKEFVLGLDLGGIRRWHSVCVSKDDSNLGKAIRGRQADRTYSREGSRGVPGICTGCGGELQLDPAPREVDAPAHGEDHNEHKIEKGEKMRKGYDDEVSKESVHGHLKELSQRADEHQKAGRKQDADALRAKIKTIKEKHGMGPAPLGKAEVAIGQTRSGKNVMAPSRQHIQAEAAFAKAVRAYGHHHPEIDRAASTLQEHHVQHMKQHQGFSAEDHEDASKLHQKLANSSQMGAGTRGDIHKDLMNTHDVAAKTVRSGGKPYWENETQKSELLAGARFHYARVVRFQQLGKSEDATKSAAMCALYVAKMGGDPSKDVPAEVRNCGPVDLQKASFHLDREVRGLPVKTLPLIKATIPNFGSSLPEEERQRDETPIHGHKALGLKLMNWHSSGSDPIYGTGSTFFAGKPVPKWQVQATLDNISKIHSEAQTPEGAQRGGWGPAEVRELGGIKNHLTRLLKTPIQKALTGAPGDTAPGATMDGGALQLAEKGARQLTPVMRASYVGAYHAANGPLPATPESVLEHINTEGRVRSLHPSEAHAVAQEANNQSDWAVFRNRADKLDRHAADLERQHPNHPSTPELAAQSRAEAAQIRSRFKGGVQKSEKSDVGHVGKDGGKGGSKALDIGDGYYVHSHGNDANGNHSVWVSKGANRARKIQTNGNLPSVHSEVGRGDKGKLTITKKGAEEIKDYHRKYHEKPVKKSECAPAGSPLEKLNMMIKGASGGASLSKAARAPRPPQEHNEDHVRELHLRR